ncbi:MAG: hypothetical protein H6517_08075 [Microthrixaceae bacterium]|nr:hypothetical protein [Microthrixaceae bacterium]
MDRAHRGRARGGAAMVLSVAVVALVVAACVPKKVSDPVEVGGAEDLVAQPPVFPETGQVPPELLVEGLVYDFSTNEVDLDLWTPSDAEARCAAESIVDSFATELSDLGYEPGRSGAGINDIALTEAERRTVAELFTACLDTEQMLGSLYMGSGHMSAAAATCMAEGLAATEMPLAVIESWLSGKGFDPIGEDASLAVLILDYTNVCLSPFSFFWTGVDLPGDEDIESVDETDNATGNGVSPEDPDPDGTISSEDRPTGSESGSDDGS